MREEKISVRFKAVGNAPILKKSRYQISRERTLSVVEIFLRGQLELDAGQQLYLYCLSSFAPDLDQTLGDLHIVFKERSTEDLIIDYSITPAY